MTKKDDLYQVWVEETATGHLVAVSPAMPKDGCELYVTEIATSIASGHEKIWSNPHCAAVIQGT